MKKSKFTMYKMLMLVSLLPLVVSVVALTIFCIKYMKSSLEDQTKTTLQVSAADLEKYYSYDLEHPETLEDGWMTYETEYVDHLKNSGVDLTIFRGDTRFSTSIVGSDGKRIEGTKASDAVIAEVINKGNDFYSDDVVINGIDYYVYYTPMRDADNKVVGMAFAGITCEKVNATINKFVNVVILMAIILLAIFVCIVLYLAKKIAAPIKNSVNVIAQIADGDLNVKNDSVSNITETQELIHASVSLRDKLSEILGNIKQVSSDLHNDANNVTNLSETSSINANQISGTMEDLANGATEMAENVQEISRQVGNMSDTVSVLSEISDALAASSDNIKNANDDASEYISKVSDSSVQTVEAVDSITKQISSTNDAVQKIKEAVDMITSIASQTNLLALNASIEAARAGEAGRGFAVVATEIGSLSDQSSKSASEIRSIVDEIVKNSEASVELSGNVADLIKEEQSYIRDTQSKFEILGREIESSLDHIRSVSNDVGELEKIQEIITDAVQSLSAISEENAASNQEVSASVTGIAASVEEIAANSDSTRSNSEKLVEAISFFK